MAYHAGLPTIDITSLASQQIWRRLSQQEQVGLAATCQFAVFMNKDRLRLELLHPHTPKRLQAIVDMPEHYAGLVCQVFAEREITGWPDAFPGQEPLKRYDILLQGQPCVLYRPAFDPSREQENLERFYRDFFE